MVWVAGETTHRGISGGPQPQGAEQDLKQKEENAANERHGG